MFRVFIRSSLILLALCAFLPHLTAAQESDSLPRWTDKAELSFVLTSGNSESTSLGVRNTLARSFNSSKLRLDAGGIRVESGTITRTAIGSGQADFIVSEQVDRETTAENYFAELRFDHELSNRTYGYSSGGWIRNRFSGIENLWVGAAGFGINLVSSDRSTFDVDLGATIASEDRTIGETETFGGLRLTWVYKRQVTETAEFLSHLVVDENLSDTEDLRAEFDNSIGVAISNVLALKTGLKILFDNQPALEEVDLLNAPGGTVVGSVLTPFNEVDTQVTVSLVVSL
jgi:putative salt-induced outer membrane protein